MGESTDLFATLDDKTRLYRRIDSDLRTKPVKFPSAFLPAAERAGSRRRSSKPAANLQSLADQLLLQKYSPAAVLVNDKGDILYISGRTGKYLEPAAGKVNWNIFAMAREGLRYELKGVFQQALRQKEAVTLKNIRVKTNGEMQAVDVTVQVVAEPKALQGMVMIVFTDVATAPAANISQTKRSSVAVLGSMERELEQARQEARITRDEMQTFEEEARCANEEMQSMNEELQSTNEELQMLNHELNVKVNDLSRLNNDMKNLLESTELTTLFLDIALNVRLFTTGSNKIFKLMPGDLGRPITDIASDLLYSKLVDDAQGSTANVGLARATARHAGRTLVFDAHHALPHAGEHD